MSQKEFDRADQEAMAMANRKGAKVKEIPMPETEGGVKVTPYFHSRAELMRQTLLSVVQILACVLVAILFVVALLDEAFVTFLAHGGVLICCMAAAVLADRAVREWKDRGRDHGGR